jgi:hypothetical protein
MSKQGGPPWPVWAAVTILVALIGAFGTSIVNRSPDAAGTPAVGSPDAPATRPAPTEPDPATVWTDRLGLFEGESVNRLNYTRGHTLLDLKSVEPSGRVRAAVTWSRGLSGAGTLVGMASGDAAELSGTILSDITGDWDSDVSISFEGPDLIRGTYRLYPRPGNPNGTQDGEFTLHRIQ